jgi:hypothetical protein
MPRQVTYEPIQEMLRRDKAQDLSVFRFEMLGTPIVVVLGWSRPLRSWSSS